MVPFSTRAPLNRAFRSYGVSILAEVWIFLCKSETLHGLEDDVGMYQGQA